MLETALERFRSQNPRIDVEFHEVLNDYRVRLDELLASESAPDVVQVREAQAGAWWSRGLLRPLEDIASIADMVRRMRPAARVAVGRGSSVVGLPFYSDVIVMAYNRSMLDDVGGRPPETWEELAAFGRELRERGISRSPLSLNFAPKVNANLPWWAMVFASGSQLIHDQRPDASPSDPSVRLLERIRAMLVEDLVLDPNLSEATYSAIESGDHAFALVGTYMARRLAVARNERGGPHIGFAAVPGLDAPGTGTVSWTPFYAVSSRSPALEQSARLALHLGGIDGTGDFFAPRFWAENEGLPPAYAEVLSDPGVKAALGQWIDVTFLDRVLSMGRPPDAIWEPWYETWEHWAQDEVMRAIWGESSAVDSMRSILSSARALQSQSNGAG